MSSHPQGLEFAFLQILSGSKKGKAIKLLSSKIVIGRSSKCDLIFKEDSLCSPEHALIYKKELGYYIESLDPQNPVLLNKKPTQNSDLKKGDQVQIGKIKLRFTLKKAESPNPIRQTPPAKKKWNPARLILVFLVLGGLALFFLDESPSTKENLGSKTEQDLIEEITSLQKENEEDIEKFKLNFKQKSAQAAFISGFRDYRKGYYKRAISFFKHCSMIDKANPLCRRYELKSLSQIEKLIEKKIRTGNAYMEKKQYSACEAAFRSVQIMMEDSSSPVYKEAEMKRKSCSIKLKNRI